jgi:Polyketide cyclase / dehydrase and lipid transport
MFRLEQTLLILFAVLALTDSARAEGDLWNALPHSEQRELLEGKVVKLEENVEGSAWPRFMIYHLVKASPATVAAVFWNCEMDPDYIPNCVAVKVLDAPESSVINAQYTLRMPFFLPDEVYVSRNHFQKLSDKDYEISWKVTQSRYSKSSVGSLRIEEHEGISLIRYTNLVVPSSRFAGMLRATAGNEVMESVQALVTKVLSEIEKDPALLEKQLRALEQTEKKPL